ncbi:unnamed protein product [Rotaria sp. Silwood1]|nr:unnamed protein product [Rotaria sp. Silwood1]
MTANLINIQGDHDYPPTNHLILWLDQSIGVSGEYIHLKKAFTSNTDPHRQAWTMLTDQDYHNLMRIGSPLSVQFEGIDFLLQAFDNEEDCLRAFDKHEEKRIFFITSGSMGKDIVPKIMEKYSHVFTDPVTKEPYSSIYVFCHNIALQVDWGFDYIDYVKMFNFDSDLLEHLVKDIALYFIEQGKRFHGNNNHRLALERFQWAKKLWHQYDKMIQYRQKNPRIEFFEVKETEQMKEINELIKKTVAALSDNMTHDGDKNDNNNNQPNDVDEKLPESCES